MLALISLYEIIVTDRLNNFLENEFSSCLFGMHQDTDSEFVTRVQTKVRNGARDSLVISPDQQKTAWIVCDNTTQKDVLSYSITHNYAPLEIELTKTGPYMRTFFVGFNKQSDIVFYTINMYDIIEVE